MVVGVLFHKTLMAELETIIIIHQDCDYIDSNAMVEPQLKTTFSMQLTSEN
jgi:hypothetical protein